MDMVLTTRAGVFSNSYLKGKNASLEMETPLSVPKKAVFSASDSGCGALSKHSSQKGISAEVMSPSM